MTNRSGQFQLVQKPDHSGEFCALPEPEEFTHSADSTTPNHPWVDEGSPHQADDETEQFLHSDAEPENFSSDWVNWVNDAVLIEASAAPAPLPSRRLSRVVVGSWIASLLLHGAIAAAAVTIVRYAGHFTSDDPNALATHAVALFAYGDASENEGKQTKAGQANTAPGLPNFKALEAPAIPLVPPTVQPEASAADQTEPTPESTPPSQALIPKNPSDEQPGPEFLPPSTNQPSSQPTLPKFKQLDWKSLADASESSGANPPSANIEPTTGPAGAMTSGDSSPNGQGGASTGRDGSADTGLPGIRAGLQTGQKLPRPGYPEASLRLGEEGTVLLEVEVLADGSVGTVTVLSDAGFPRLADAAVRSLQGVVLRPALSKSGKPMRDVIPIPYKFHRR